MRPTRLLLVVVVSALVVGCAGSSATTSTSTTSAREVVTTLPPETTTTEDLGDTSSVAEDFVEAFYSLDAERLADLPWSSSAVEQEMAAYQDWARGAGYFVISREPCVAESAVTASCDSRLSDFFGEAWGYELGERFEIFLNTGGEISGVGNQTEDPNGVFGAFWRWSQDSHPELHEEGAVCHQDTQTPEVCSSSLTGFAHEFAESDAFVPPS